MLNAFMPKPRLKRPRIVSRIRQRIAASMPQHVRMDRERHLGVIYLWLKRLSPDEEGED
jgi:hypothetical protein